MAEKKNQHFLPQFLLRRFAGSSGERSIALLNLSSRRVIRGASIRGQAARSYLYGKDGVLEDGIREVEGGAATHLRNISSSRSVPQPRTSARNELMFFVALQLARSPAAGAEIDALNDHMAKAWLRQAQRHGQSPDVDLSSFRVRKANPIVDALRNLSDSWLFFLDLDVIVVENEAEAEFVLPDLGITAHNEWRQQDPQQRHTGGDALGLQLYFPTSPRQMLLFYDPNVYAPRAKRNARHVLRKNQDVRQLNALAIADAYENVYFTGDERTASQICGKLKRPAPRHQALVAETIETEDEALVFVYPRSSEAQIDLPILQVCRPYPNHPNALPRPFALEVHEELERRRRQRTPEEKGHDGERWLREHRLDFAGGGNASSESTKRAGSSV